MNKEELKIIVADELSWLSYYAFSGSKKELDLTKPLYDQLTTGYAKRAIELHKRCAFLRLTADAPITYYTPLDHLKETGLYRDNANNIYTALEIWMIKYPEENNWVLEKLM